MSPEKPMDMSLWLQPTSFCQDLQMLFNTACIWDTTWNSDHCQTHSSQTKHRRGLALNYAKAFPQLHIPILERIPGRWHGGLRGQLQWEYSERPGAVWCVVSTVTAPRLASESKQHFPSRDKARHCVLDCGRRPCGIWVKEHVLLTIVYISYVCLCGEFLMGQH